MTGQVVLSLYSLPVIRCRISLRHVVPCDHGRPDQTMTLPRSVVADLDDIEPIADAVHGHDIRVDGNAVGLVVEVFVDVEAAFFPLVVVVVVWKEIFGLGPAVTCRNRENLANKPFHGANNISTLLRRCFTHIYM